MTDWQKVQALFENSKGKIISPMEIINHINSVEYSGRITNAREDWHCTCGQDPDSCTAEKHIVNIGKNKYIFKGKSQPVDTKPTESVNQALINYKLSLLRDEYRNTKNEVDKRLIELRAKALKNTLTTQKPLKPETIEVESNLLTAAREVLL